MFQLTERNQITMTTQRIELTEKDVMIFHVINRWRVAQLKHIKSFLGFGSDEYLKRRLRNLSTNNYIKRSRKHIRESYVYELGELGKEVLDITKAGQVSSGTLDHELGVLTCACFFREYFSEASLDYHSMITDRDFRSYEYSKNATSYGYKKMTRKGDLTFKVGDKWWIVEYEKEKKSFQRIQENVTANKNRAYGQIWVYPKLRTSIAKGLTEASQMMGVDDDRFKLFTFDEIEKVLHRPSARIATSSSKPIEEWIEEYNKNEDSIFYHRY